MDWVNVTLPFPVYQQEKEEKCLDFWARIEWTLPEAIMRKEETTFWFLLGARDDIIKKIPFNPKLNMWMDPDVLRKQLGQIDNNERLDGPFRKHRFQNCHNFFFCFSCGYWGHKCQQCRNQQLDSSQSRRLKKKCQEFLFEKSKPEKEGQAGGGLTNRKTENSGYVGMLANNHNTAPCLPKHPGSQEQQSFYEDEPINNITTFTNGCGRARDANVNSNPFSEFNTSLSVPQLANSAPSQQKVVWELPTRSQPGQVLWETPNQQHNAR